MSKPIQVLVAGGGSAGLAAAVASARSGARTLLVERSENLGGMVSAALVHSICGLYRLSDSETPIFANPGFATEFAQRLLASGGGRVVRMGRVDLILHEPNEFLRLCNEIVRETPLLEIRFQTEVVQVAGGSTIQQVELSSRGVHETVEPITVVDATGDAGVTALSGAGFERENPEKLQRPAFIASLKDVELSTLEEAGRMKLAHSMVTAVREQHLPKGALGAMFRISSQARAVFVTLDLEGPAGMLYDPTDPICLSALKQEGEELATRIVTFLKVNMAGFTNCSISEWPTQVGVRESRRIQGRYRMEAEDLLIGRRFEDEVALATWPIELREQATGARLRFPKNGEPCGIPLRALRSLGVDNLFAAGRCLSASHEAQASLRVIGTCLATGEAAGIAAALLAVSGRCEAAEIRETREKLPRP